MIIDLSEQELALFVRALRDAVAGQDKVARAIQKNENRSAANVDVVEKKKGMIRGVGRPGAFDENNIILRRFPLQIESGLSNAARGFYVLLIMGLENWSPSINGFAAFDTLPDGKARIAAQCKELREAGYLRFARNKDGTVDWLVTQYAHDFGNDF